MASGAVYACWMSICAACGHENEPGARFCSQCATPLAATPPQLQQERKVVTVLFADLVGFTSQAERMDPEDVRELLSPYYNRLRGELEHFGGTVEKFIGDAVMALFGAPRAHEDDPERAVRAALAIRDWVREEERLQVRIAVNTGEALVTLDARAAEGEGMAAGDVVNTTARLQTAAPVNGILVGETTYRATRHVVEYAEAPPVEAKGKDEPIAVWEAQHARASFGVDVPLEVRTALFGRERELDVVRSALQRVREEPSPQLVTLVGVPGIGKSRLVYELSQIVDADTELISWRQGRSLPYGEGVSFWALVEMVKAQAGILETDDIAETEAKLARMVADVLPSAADADWVRRHLGTLLGLAEAAGDQSETFSAWRGFFEALAEQRPLVLVFEDLHWADDSLLDFVDHLVDWAAEVPILVVGTARPELLERRPGWGGGKANAITLSLSPLSNNDTARLLGSLLGSSIVEAGQQADLLARAGGNPLYAEQYAHMLAERGDAEELPLPESVQGIIGARLDALPAEEKRLLQDAAVIGKVFWPGAVAAPGGERLQERLHALERKQFVRRERRSSMAGETQYAFLHLLLRDVAYGQIPRASRIEKHAGAAEWIEAHGRLEDHSEMLAHHYTSALELARAARHDVSALAPRARAVLRDAGDRARALNAFSAAARFYREALDLWPEEAVEERADLLFRLGTAALGTGEAGRREMLEEARAALLDVGDRERAAEADTLLGEISWIEGRSDLSFFHLERGFDLVRDAPASPGKARVLTQLTRYRMLADDFDPEQSREALELAEAFGGPEQQAHALITIGTGRFKGGDSAGRGEIEQGLELALRENLLGAAVRAYSNLASLASLVGGRLDEAVRLTRESERVAERLGSSDQLRWARGNTIEYLVAAGEWDECARAAEDYLAESDSFGPHYQDCAVLGARSIIRLGRGDLEGALADQAAALATGRTVKDPQALYPSLRVSSFVLADIGRVDEALVPFDELFAQRLNAFEHADSAIGDLIRLANVLDRREEARTALASAQPKPWTTAGRALLEDDYDTAIEVFERGHALRSAASTRLWAAEALVAAGRRAEADEHLHKALAFFRSVGATRWTRAGEALLAATA